MRNWLTTSALNTLKRPSTSISLIATVGLALSLNYVDAKTNGDKSSGTKTYNEKNHGSKNNRPVIKTINFPKDYSLGLLCIIPYKPTDLAASTQLALSRQEAKGEVKIRDEGWAVLTGGYQLARNMNILKRLRPDDLQVLDMYRTDVEDKDIQNIAGLTGLVGLQLDETEVGDESLKTFCHLPNLKFLSLSSTQLTGSSLACLVTLKNLKRLELGHNVLKKEYLSDLIKLRQLERLGLQGCQITDQDLETISKLDNLRSLLLLENTQITDLGMKKIASLKKLLVLEITHAQITPNGLKALVELPLKHLIINKNQFTPSQIERIKKMFPKAEISIHDNSNRLDPELFRPLH